MFPTYNSMAQVKSGKIPVFPLVSIMLYNSHYSAHDDRLTKYQLLGTTVTQTINTRQSRSSAPAQGQALSEAACMRIKTQECQPVCVTSVPCMENTWKDFHCLWLVRGNSSEKSICIWLMNEDIVIRLRSGRMK